MNFNSLGSDTHNEPDCPKFHSTIYAGTKSNICGIMKSCLENFMPVVIIMSIYESAEFCPN